MQSELDQLLASMNQIDFSSINTNEEFKRQAEEINQQIESELTETQRQLVEKKQQNELELQQITQKRVDLEEELISLQDGIQKETQIISKLKEVNNVIQRRVDWIDDLKQKCQDDEYVLQQISRLSDQDLRSIINEQNLGIIIKDSQGVNHELNQLKRQLRQYEEKCDQIQQQLELKVIQKTHLQQEYDRVQEEYNEIAKQIPDLPLNNGQTLHKNISQAYLKVKSDQQKLLHQFIDINEQRTTLNKYINTQKTKKLELMMESKLLDLELKGRLDVLHFLEDLKENYRSSINQTEHNHNENILYVQKNQPRVQQLEKINIQLEEKVRLRELQISDRITALWVLVVVLFLILNSFIFWIKRVDPIIADVEIGL